MITIRNLVLDAVALAGVAAGLAAGLGGYLANLPDPPERAALARAWADPETTGSIAPTARTAPPDGRPARADGTAGATARGTWTDPPRHRTPRAP